MLECGHEQEPFGSPMCVHLRGCRDPHISFVRWYTGSVLDMELLCNSCANERQEGRLISVAVVCEKCFEYATTEVGDLVGVRGTPEIRVRGEPFDVRLDRIELSKEFGKIVDIAPVAKEGQSIWFLLAEDGRITQFDVDKRLSRQLARSNLDLEPDHEPWCGHIL